MNTRPTVTYAGIAPIYALTFLLSGCTFGRGAPSFTLFGAFFPGWMFCAVIGVLAAICARGIFVYTGWSNILPYQLFVSTAAGTIFGLLVWLLWFGR